MAIRVKTMQLTNTIKIFLASSIIELKDERKELTDYIMSSVKPLFEMDGVDVRLFKCEDYHSGNLGGSSQDEIDKWLLESDISIFLFKGKAGDKTIREFNLARKMQTVRRHEIYVYCFDVPEHIKKEDLKAFQHRLENELFYWKTCKDVADLKSQFIIGLIIFEKQLLGIGTTLAIEQKSTAEKDGDARFAEYEKGEKSQTWLRAKIHEDIENLLQQTKTVMRNENDTIASRIVKIIELYKKADRWAVATKYDKKKYLEMLLNHGEFAFKYGVYGDAKIVFLQYAELIKELYGENNERFAFAYSKIGAVYDSMKNYELALNNHQIALKTRIRVLGRNNLTTADSFVYLGIVYSQMNKNMKAIIFFYKALNIRKKMLGKDNPSLSRDYNNLGWLFCIQDLYSIALFYLKKAIKLEKDLDEAVIPYVYNNIGFAYMCVNRNEEALSYLRKAIDIREKKLGTKHPDTIESYINLGYLYEKMKNDELSILCYKKINDLPPDHIKPIHHRICDSRNWRKIIMSLEKYTFSYLESNWK